MDTSLLADWCTKAFFAWIGLKKFIPALDRGIFPTIGAILALPAAVFIATSA